MATVKTLSLSRPHCRTAGCLLLCVGIETVKSELSFQTFIWNIKRILTPFDSFERKKTGETKKKQHRLRQANTLERNEAYFCCLYIDLRLVIPHSRFVYIHYTRIYFSSLSQLCTPLVNLRSQRKRSIHNFLPC